VLNICHGESKVFSTKERSPYYICIELCRIEEDEISILDKDRRVGWTSDNRLSIPIMIESVNLITNIKKQSFLGASTTNIN
jgi:hypothetical protein